MYILGCSKSQWEIKVLAGIPEAKNEPWWWLLLGRGASQYEYISWDFGLKIRARSWLCFHHVWGVNLESCQCVNLYLDGDWTTHWTISVKSDHFHKQGLPLKLNPRTSIVWTLQNLSTLVPPSHHCPTNPLGCLSKWPESSHVVLRVHRWNDNPQQPVQHTRVRLNKLWGPKPIAKQSCTWKVQ